MSAAAIRVISSRSLDRSASNPHQTPLLRRTPVPKLPVSEAACYVEESPGMLEAASQKIVVAHSPDSDDAFMFYGLATLKLRSARVSFVLQDIETLNQAGMEGRYDMTAISYHAYPYVAGHYVLTSAGSSVGDGYGPVVIALKDIGRFEVTKNEADKGAFKTPSLRNIALTAPYMHDGSLKALKDVVDFYVGGGNSNPWRDKEIKSLEHLTRAERDDLVVFLQALTGEVPANTGRP